MTGDRRQAFDQIAQGVVYGNLGIFVGAGLPMAIMNTNGDSIAFSWQELVEECAVYFEIDIKKIFEPGKSYPEIASSLCKSIASKEKITVEEAEIQLKQKISDLTSLYPDSPSRAEYKRHFDTLSPKWIITTNYDTIIESVLTGTGHSIQSEDQLIAPAGMIPVFHLHGIRTNPSSIVITQEDYVKLFRPNNYRLQKLPLTIKESVTLLIGYSLGDFNVLTALDWSKNVLQGKKSNYPNEIIQLVRMKNPKSKPYKRDEIWIIEFWDLSKCLAEICEYVSKRKRQAKKSLEKLKELEKKFAKPTKSMVKKFIADNGFREEILTHLKDNKHAYINGFLELLSRSLDQVWTEARKTNQFQEYNTYLKILLDILDTIEVSSVPPALMQSIAFHLDKVAYYIGTKLGDAHAAHRTWTRRGKKFDPMTIKELENISNLNPNYYHLRQALKKLK